MDYLDKAIEDIWLKRKIEISERIITVALLLPESGWRIVTAPWWKGKQASIIGVDYSGNFILVLSGGRVALWDHSIQQTIDIATSVKGFVSMLTEGPSALP